MKCSYDMFAILRTVTHILMDKKSLSEECSCMHTAAL